jgi:hypothetical protein
MFRRLCSRRKRTTARIVTDGSETLFVATQIVGCGAGVPSVWAAAGRLGSRSASSPAFPPSNTLANPTCENACQPSPFTVNFHRKLAITCQSLSESWLMPRARVTEAAAWLQSGTELLQCPTIYSPTVLQSCNPIGLSYLRPTIYPATKTGIH